MKKRATIAVAAALALAALPSFAEDPQTIVSTMEKKMYPDSRTQMTLDSVSGDKREKYALTSYARDDNQKIIVRFSAPASMVGSDLLMLDRNVWLYDPKSGREMKIPSNQSFGGTGFSYGDVLRLNFSDNYSATLASEDDSGWTLDLAAKERDAPYNRVTLVVSRDYTPVSGKCYTRSGELIKEIRYSGIADVGGGKKPLVTTVTSPVSPQDKSTLTIVKETLKSYPPNVFNKKNLSARMEESN
jgi:outer membrane lipoprotein-sorting protein